MPNLIPHEIIEKKIYLIRDLRVMLDKDLAELYGVKPIRLREQVRRNIFRFPQDFMFRLNEQEIDFMVSQNAIPSRKYLGGYRPYVFTEQGVAMLSNVLNSKRAIRVNISIMRVFVKIRRMIFSHRELADKLSQLERRIERHDEETKTIFRAIRNLMIPSHTTLISPQRPFTNKKILWDTIKSCNGYIYWIDKYFSKVGLETLSESLDLKKVKKIKILMSVDKVDEKLKDLFKNFKQELKNRKVICELRVIIDKKIKSDIHDRWIISKNVCFNVPSTDTLARGQYSEIKRSTNKLPFKVWWDNSRDIIVEWNEIKKLL